MRRSKNEQSEAVVDVHQIWKSPNHRRIPEMLHRLSLYLYADQDHQIILEEACQNEVADKLKDEMSIDTMVDLAQPCVKMNTAVHCASEMIIDLFGK